MGLQWRKTIRLGRTRVNLSKRGASTSRKVGPVTITDRGRGSIRLGKGISWRFKL